MEREIVELVCLVDKSRSMYGREQDVLDIYNSLLEDYRGRERKCYVTTCLFSDTADVIYLHNEMKHVRPLTQRDYCVEGDSAIFDAVCDTFAQVDECLQYIKDEIKKQVNVYVITDGIDNCSVRFVCDEFLSLIQQKAADGWNIELMDPGRKSLESQTLYSEVRGDAPLSKVVSKSAKTFLKRI